MGSASDALIANFRATRVTFKSWGTKRALDDDRKDQVAAVFGADTDFLGASKRLVNTKAKAFRKVTSIKSRTQAAWKRVTLPYPEDGLRLIRESDLNDFASLMETARNDLNMAVFDLDNEFYQLKMEARVQLGDLYDENDYPQTLQGLFDVSWEFPNVQAPEYLRQLNPRLYEQEQARIAARFDEAVAMAEQAFVVEFQKFVAHLTERLTPGADGRPKEFKESTVTNLTEFFERFRHLSVRSNAELDSLVERAQSLVRGVRPDDLMPEGGVTTAMQDVLRRHVAQNMASISDSLQGMIVAKPRRRVIRGNVPVEAA